MPLRPSRYLRTSRKNTGGQSGTLDEVLTYEEEAGDEGRACPCPFGGVGFVCVVDRYCNLSLLKLPPLRPKISSPGAQLTVSTSFCQQTVQFQVVGWGQFIYKDPYQQVASRHPEMVEKAMFYSTPAKIEVSPTKMNVKYK